MLAMTLTGTALGFRGGREFPSPMALPLLRATNVKAAGAAIPGLRLDADPG
jgi:hypothetical protein